MENSEKLQRFAQKGTEEQFQVSDSVFTRERHHKDRRTFGSRENQQLVFIDQGTLELDQKLESSTIPKVVLRQLETRNPKPETRN